MPKSSYTRSEKEVLCRQELMLQLWTCTGHGGSQCRSRGCFKCGSKHHTSICDKNQNPKLETGGVLNGYSRSPERNSLPAIIPVKIWGEVMC